MTEQPTPYSDYDAYLDDPDDETTDYTTGADDDADTNAADEPDPEEG